MLPKPILKLLPVLVYLLFDCTTDRQFVHQTASPHLFNPRQVKGELLINIVVHEKFDGKELAAWNLAHGIPSDQAPQLLIWSADIQNQSNQLMVENQDCTPKPTEIFSEPENHNRILFWDFSDRLSVGSEIRIRRLVQYSSYDFAPRIDPHLVATKWDSVPTEILSFYTKPERSLEQTPEMKAEIARLIGSETNPFLQSRLIFNWVQNHMTYVYPPEARGAIPAFESGTGDCGQYSALFITLCRIAGIPARQQSGFNFIPGNTGYHVWSEIYLPPYGWIPMDATRENGFGFIDNTRLIASVGMNIPLKHVPKWSTFDYQEAEAGRTNFMQLFTMVASGVELEIDTELKVVKSEELND